MLVGLYIICPSMLVKMFMFQKNYRYKNFQFIKNILLGNKIYLSVQRVLCVSVCVYPASSAEQEGD